MDETAFVQLLERVKGSVARAGVFDGQEIEGGMLVCAARAAAQPAFYRVELDGGRVWVSLVMKDRWLSESIESTLMHSGDKMEELLEEELVDQEYEGGPMGIEHFRSDDMFFTFRSSLDDPSPASVTRALLAYEACFGVLGDMNPGEDD